MHLGNVADESQIYIQSTAEYTKRYEEISIKVAVKYPPQNNSGRCKRTQRDGKWTKKVNIIRKLQIWPRT